MHYCCYVFKYDIASSTVYVLHVCICIYTYNLYVLLVFFLFYLLSLTTSNLFLFRILKMFFTFLRVASVNVHFMLHNVENIIKIITFISFCVGTECMTVVFYLYLNVIKFMFWEFMLV